MLVVSRFRVADDEAEGFRADLEEAHALLASKPGYLTGRIGRSMDEPALWALVTTWENVGAYRRALSAYEAVEPGADLNVADSRSLG